MDGSDPLLLNGYGSYEISNDPWFNANRLCLLDRGFVFAMVSAVSGAMNDFLPWTTAVPFESQAHIRGGGEMGREWYEDGERRRGVCMLQSN